MRKAFLVCAVGLVYNFDKKPTASVWKGVLTAKMPFDFIILGNLSGSIFLDSHANIKSFTITKAFQSCLYEAWIQSNPFF